MFCGIIVFNEVIRFAKCIEATGFKGSKVQRFQKLAVGSWQLAKKSKEFKG
jgi:hypothetical protein